MAYRTYRRRSTYRRPMARSRRRETFKAARYGQFGLTTANQTIVPINLMSGYESSANAARETERATITSVRGWITYSFQGNPAEENLDKRIWFGTGVRLDEWVQQLDAIAERNAVAPYTFSAANNDRANYADWQWLVSRPYAPAEVSTDTLAAHDTTLWQYKNHRIPVNIRQMRKLRSIDDSLYLFAGLNFDPGSGNDVTVRYDLTVHAMRP